MPSTDGSDYLRLPQLLKTNGDYFSAIVVVQKYLPPYTHNYRESVTLGNNATGRTVVGDSWNASDGFAIEVWGAGTYIELSEDAWAVETNGILTLRVPSISDSSEGDLYSVIIDIPPMSRLYPRREGGVQVFTVDVENVEVLGHETY